MADGVSLSSVIEEVYGSAISLGEKRRLAARAIALRLHGKSEAPPCEDSERDPVLFLEDVLAASAAACGMPVQRMSVPQAKALLKQHFGDVGRQLASRIGRASKLRNAKAHPDRSLLQAIQSL